MKYQPPEDGLHQDKFPNGKLSAERTIKNGKQDGFSRSWHENGQLAQEQPFKNGLLHGMARQWDAKGKLIEQRRFNDGTGVLRQWQSNGQMCSEISYFCGNITGRMRTFDKDGMLYGQEYFLSGRSISKKKYLAECARNLPELPRFKDEKLTNTLGNYVRRLRQAKRRGAKLGPTPEQLQSQQYSDQWYKDETKQPTSKELISWLTKRAKGKRELSEVSGNKASALAHKLYAFGAIKVWAANIERAEDGDQYANRLIVKLPDSKLDRSNIYKLCARVARPFSDSTPAIGVGLNYMSVSLM